MKKIIIILIVLAGISVASTRVYDTEPYQNCNGWTDRWQYIGETFTAICDSFVWVDFFVGTPSIPGQFHFEITPSVGGSPIYEGWAEVPSIGYQYVRSDSLIRYGIIIKGRQYILKITHSNGDSINFYYDSTNSYQYGQISSGGGILHPPPQNASRCDLAARIEGININSC